MDTNQLEQLGLSEREAKVYLALLELGTGSVAEIATKAKINRTTTYDVLEYLSRDGLAGHVGEEKKKHYVAESPDNLLTYLDKKAKEFQNKSDKAKKILPELKGVFNRAPLKPKVRFYDGDDGIIAMYEDSLSSKSEILSWLNTSKTYDFSSEYFADYYRRRASKKIHMRAIIDDTPLSRELIKRDKVEDRESRLVDPKKMTLEPECYIYENKVAFMSLRERFGVIIESQDIADAQRQLYELAWDKASKK